MVAETSDSWKKTALKEAEEKKQEVETAQSDESTEGTEEGSQGSEELGRKTFRYNLVIVSYS